MRHLRILLPLLMFSCLSIATRAAVINSPTFNSDLPLRELIKLSPRSYSKATGQNMNLKERLTFRLLKSSMKKAIRKNQHVTLREFLASKRKTDLGSSILIILLLVLLMGFVLFVITFQDKV